MPRISEDVLLNISASLLKSSGASNEEATIVSEHCIDANLAGHDSHGTWLLPGYVRGMKHRSIRWEEHKVVRENLCLRQLMVKVRTVLWR